MGIHEKTVYWLTCDGEKCHADVGRYDDIDDEGQLLEAAEESDWIKVGDGKGWLKWYCPKCAPKYEPEEEVKPHYLSFLDAPTPQLIPFATQWWE